MENLMTKNVIISDTGCEVPEEFTEAVKIFKVPFHIIIDGTDFTDDENLDSQKLLQDMKAAKKGTQSACPSPQDFLDKFEEASDAENLYVITMSSKISGSYNAALNAKEMFLETYPDKSVYVIDSLSATVGETSIAYKIKDCLERGVIKKDLVHEVEDFIKDAELIFILQDFTNLVRNGRLSKSKAAFASVLNIIPIMKGLNGEVEIAAKARGMNKAIQKLVNSIEEKGVDISDRILSIAHCNAPELAKEVHDLILEKKYNFKSIVISQTHGISTVYAQQGGVLLAY